MNPINKWHNKLNMPKYDEEWHKQDMADELAKYEEAHGLIDTWSELSDVGRYPKIKTPFLSLFIIHQLGISPQTVLVRYHALNVSASGYSS